MNIPRQKQPKSLTEETCERSRRIETRLTQLMVFLGAPTGAQSPRFTASSDGGSATIQLPSPHSSMKEILDNIPKSWKGPVRVFVGADLVATIVRSGN